MVRFFIASAAACALLVPQEARLLTDFTAASPDLGWTIVNDNVMGGKSLGRFDRDSGTLRFTGSTNTDGGGFSSIRTRPVELDLSAYAGIGVRVRADGRRYIWLLTTGASWRGQEVTYWADFDSPKGEWLDVRIPFSRFRPTFRGTELPGPALEPARISGMGLMIYDGQDGPFALDLDRVAAYAPDSGGW